MILFAATDEIARISRFGLVGIFNTVLDFTVFNALSSKRVNLDKIWANTISTTIAMTLSFFINRSYVFDKTGSDYSQAALFFAVTAFGLYVLQNGVIFLLTTYWSWPKKAVNALTKSERIPLETDFVLKNGAKVIGTVLSLSWNYLLYGRIVFRGK